MDKPIATLLALLIGLAALIYSAVAYLLRRPVHALCLVLLLYFGLLYVPSSIWATVLLVGVGLAILAGLIVLAGSIVAVAMFVRAWGKLPKKEVS